GIYPESVYGLLDKVDTILGKILNIIFVEKITSCQDLAFILKNKKVLARGELNDSLIGILINCPLLACVRDLESLTKYLRCPGEEIKNIILSVDKKNWNLTHGALKILEKERYRRGKHREVENKCIFLHLPRLQWLRVATVAGGTYIESNILQFRKSR
ncbi:TPA: hypothetical protein OU321_003824, partial [Escherichia coli]|nr:hypothetical protein [Escherichia coli]